MERSIDIECPACKGTGIYSGMGEVESVGVVCSNCKGKGCYTYRYKPFAHKNIHPYVRRVLRCNPGIKAGDHDDFGGMRCTDWFAGVPFPEKSEMRLYTCPAWWFQSTDYDLKPDWDTCIGIGSFNDCASFKTKACCWTRFDDEGKKYDSI